MSKAHRSCFDPVYRKQEGRVGELRSYRGSLSPSPRGPPLAGLQVSGLLFWSLSVGVPEKAGAGKVADLFSRAPSKDEKGRYPALDRVVKHFFRP